MADIEWLKMLTYQQELHHLSRELLTQTQKQNLTASERELLVRLYLAPENSTPLSLSRSTGMKKEAVSRCLRSLYEKGCIRKERHPHDERSYMLSLTETGNKELKESYRAMLKPLYELRRRMGIEFETMFELICRANRMPTEEVSTGIRENGRGNDEIL